MMKIHLTLWFALLFVPTVAADDLQPAGQGTPPPFQACGPSPAKATAGKEWCVNVPRNSSGGAMYFEFSRGVVANRKGMTLIVRYVPGLDRPTVELAIAPKTFKPGEYGTVRVGTATLGTFVVIDETRIIFDLASHTGIGKALVHGSDIQFSFPARQGKVEHGTVPVAGLKDLWTSVSDTFPEAPDLSGKNLSKTGIPPIP